MTARPDPMILPRILTPSRNYRLGPEYSWVQASVTPWSWLSAIQGSLRINDGAVRIAEDSRGPMVRASIRAASYSLSKANLDQDLTWATLRAAAGYSETSFTGQELGQSNERWPMEEAVSYHGAPGTVEVSVNHTSLEGGVARFHASARLDRNRWKVAKGNESIGSGADLIIDALATPL